MDARGCADAHVGKRRRLRYVTGMNHSEQERAGGAAGDVTVDAAASEAAAPKAGLVIAAPPQSTLAVAGTAARFPVRRIYCVGRNYAAHTREMGGDPDREEPFFFAKPRDAAVDASAADGVKLAYPPATGELHHEIELVVALGAGGSEIAPSQALALVYGYAVGVDLTRRDVQRAAKASGRPWAMAKGFDASAPCSAIAPAAEIGHPKAGSIWLAVDGDRRQEGDIAQLVWSVAEILAALSQQVTLAPGDLLFTGTPAGVGSVARGQTITGHVDGVGDLRVTMV